MERFTDLNERKIHGNYDVHVMHHYTTMQGLSGILHKGYLEARESKGDNDWGDYITSRSVVSFLDSKYDSELENLINANANNGTLEGNTQHLALHMSKIAVLIEVNLDEIEEPVELLTLMLRNAQTLHDNWNDTFGKVDEDLEYAEGMLKELFPPEVRKKNNWTDEEIEAWNEKVRNCKWCRPSFEEKGHMIESDVKWLTRYNVFSKIYEHPIVKEDGTTQYISKWYYNPWVSFEEIRDDCLEFKRIGIKRMDDKTGNELQKAIDDADVRKMFNILRGMGVPLMYFREGWNLPRHERNAWGRFKGLDEVANGIRTLLINKEWVDIELRVPQDIRLTPDNCRIHIFSNIRMSDTDKKRIQSIINYNNKKKAPLDIRIVEGGQEPDLLSEE